MVLNSTQFDYTYYKVRELVRKSPKAPRRWVNVFGPCPLKKDAVMFLLHRGAVHRPNGDWVVKLQRHHGERIFRLYIIDPESPRPNGEQIVGRPGGHRG